mgnify:CR=1 FL=1
MKKIIWVLLLICLMVSVTGCTIDPEFGKQIQDQASEHNLFLQFVLNIHTGALIQGPAQAASLIYSSIDGVLQLSPDIYQSQDSLAAIEESVSTLAQGLMAIFIVIQLMSELNRKGDDFRWEDGARIVAEFIVLKVIFDTYPDILSAMYESGKELVRTTYLTMGDEVRELILTELVAPLTTEVTGVWGPVLWLFNYLGVSLFCMVLDVIGMIIFVICICRVIQLAIMTVVAPLPIAFVIWSETRDITKRFFLGYFAVCLQGAFIFIAFSIFSYTKSDVLKNVLGLGDGLLPSLLSLIILAVCVISSGRWAKEILGVA